jgi:hypothetical protein
MQILAILRRRVENFPEADFAARLDDEAEMLRRLYAESFVRHAWTREDVPGAVLMLEAPDVETASAELQRLPLVGRDMMEVKLIPIKGYRGFGPRT